MLLRFRRNQRPHEKVHFCRNGCECLSKCATKARVTQMSIFCLKVITLYNLLENPQKSLWHYISPSSCGWRKFGQKSFPISPLTEHSPPPLSPNPSPFPPAHHPLTVIISITPCFIYVVSSGPLWPTFYHNHNHHNQIFLKEGFFHESQASMPNHR